IRPCFFVKENFAFAGVAVEPAGDEEEVFAKVAGDESWFGGFKAIAEELFEGARFAGELRKIEQEGLGEATSDSGEGYDSLICTGALQDDEIQVLDTAGKFGLAAESLVNFFQFLVEGAGFFEVEIFAGSFAV